MGLGLLPRHSPFANADHLSPPFTCGKMLDLGKEWEILQKLLPTQVIVDLADSISCLDSVPIHRPNPSLSAIMKSTLT